MYMANSTRQNRRRRRRIRRRRRRRRFRFLEDVVTKISTFRLFCLFDSSLT